VLYSHDIKGAARNIGAEEVGRIAKDMEEKARTENYKKVAELLPSLREAFEKLEKAFGQYFAAGK